LKEVSKETANDGDSDPHPGSEGTGPACIVCRAPRCRHFARLESRLYWRCPGCQATFLDSAQQPAREAEAAEYALHENDPDEPGYRRFLSRLTTRLFPLLPAGARGLDYGCGPGPALPAMASEQGFDMQAHDPLFGPELPEPGEGFDFITCTEVWEHFHAPWQEFPRLDRLLRPGGWLGVMTCFQTDDARFANWHYRRDPTHVVFYREATMHRIASLMGWECRIPVKDVVLFRKKIC